ncbi:glycosyltransferase 87 family protein [Nocardia sp. CA-129566]|uniref:glycosyltransferase 87 family protein n=1 Tax=Nocardia sp. CA-129566 TaxID=3239976 RepID=UPI003D98A033
MRDTRKLEFPRRGPAIYILAGSALLSVILLFTTIDPFLDKGGFLVGGLDVHIYRDGAFRIVHDIPLYTEPTMRGLLYTYTPFSTIAFVPIYLVPWGYVTNTWLVFNLGVLIGCVLLSWRLLGYRITARLVVISVLLAATCVFIEPVRQTLYFGQINLVLMLLILLDALRDDYGKVRGIGVGLAAGIKLTPIYFVAYFVALRQWRSAVTACATFLASIAFAWVILPADSREYWTSTFFQSNRIAVDTHPANQSIRGVIAHVLDRPAPVWLWLLIAGSIAIASLVVTTALYQRGERLLSITLAGLTACAVSPFSWGHHWVWFVPLLVYLVHKARDNWRWWVAAAVLFTATAAWTYHWSRTWVSIGVFLLPPWWPITKVMINGYVIAFLAVLIGAWIHLRRDGWSALSERSAERSIRLPLLRRRDPESPSCPTPSP